MLVSFKYKGKPYRPGTDFYDTPHGSILTTPDHEGHVPEWVKRYTDYDRDGNPVPGKIKAGYTSGPDGSVFYTTSRGNWVLYRPDGTGLAGGHRHGIPWWRAVVYHNPTSIIEDVIKSWEYLETQREDLAPYETAT